MDEKVKKVIVAELAKGYIMNKKGLETLKLAIVSKTGEFKYLSLTNLKKWVNEAKKELKSPKKKKLEKTEKELASTEIPEDNLRFEPQVQDNAPVNGEKLDRVFRQNMLFEITHIRQILARVSKRLDDLQKSLGKE